MANEMRKRNRQIIDERDTYDYSTPDLKISATEVNTYQEMNHRTKSLLSALGVVPEIANTATEVLEVSNRKQTELGIANRQSGNMDVSNKTEAYLKGWDHTEGQYKAIEFNAQMQMFFEDNKDADPAEFKKKYDELLNGYTQDKSKEYLSGFAPAALESEARIQSSYQAYNLEKLKGRELEAARGLLANAFTMKTLETFNKNGINITSLEELYNDPKLFKQYMDNRVKLDKELSINLRQTLNGLQSDYKLKGMFSNKEDLSKAALQVANELNAHTGVNFAGFVREKDASGVSIIDTNLVEAATSLEHNSSGHASEMYNASYAKYKENQEVKNKALYADWVEKIYGMTDAQRKEFCLKNKEKVFVLQDEMKENPEIYFDLLKSFNNRASYEPPKSEETGYNDSWIKRMNSLYIQGKLSRNWIVQNEPKMSAQGRQYALGFLREFESDTEQAERKTDAAAKKNEAEISLAKIQPDANRIYSTMIRNLGSSMDAKLKAKMGQSILDDATYEYIGSLRSLYAERKTQGKSVTFQDVQNLSENIQKKYSAGGMGDLVVESNKTQQPNKPVQGKQQQESNNHQIKKGLTNGTYKNSKLRTWVMTKDTTTGEEVWYNRLTGETKPVGAKKN